jgi:thioredoxin reductase (NADPH)
VTEVLGDSRVTGVRLDKPYDGSDTLELDGIFVAIGGIPYSDLAKKLGVETNEKGEITIDRSSRTNVEGVFAAGDVVDTEFKQAITGVAEGVHAAYQAYRYVSEREFAFKC